MGGTSGIEVHGTVGSQCFGNAPNKCNGPQNGHIQPANSNGGHHSSTEAANGVCRDVWNVEKCKRRKAINNCQTQPIRTKCPETCGLCSSQTSQSGMAGHHKPTKVIGTTASGAEVSRPFGSNRGNGRPKPAAGASGSGSSGTKIHGNVGSLCISKGSNECNGPQNGQIISNGGRSPASANGGGSGTNGGLGQFSNQQINGGIGHICVGDASGKCNGPQNGGGRPLGGGSSTSTCINGIPDNVCMRIKNQGKCGKEKNQNRCSKTCGKC